MTSFLDQHRRLLRLLSALVAVGIVLTYPETERGLPRQLSTLEEGDEPIPNVRTPARELLQLDGTTEHAPGDVDDEKELSWWVAQLDPRRRLPLISAHSRNITQLDACPDVFIGHQGQGGAPSWRDGDCASVPALHDILTIIMAGPNITKLRAIAVEAAAIYPNVTVLTTELSPTSGSSSKDGAAVAWNRLAEKVTTKYTLVARDLSHVTDDARLWRLLSVMSVFPAVSVAGGATRNESGHWQLGCWQTRVSAYELQRTEGYELSAPGECMYCDATKGPFLVRTSLLSGLAFDESLAEEMLFEDWFLRLKESGELAVVCPDVLFYTNPINPDLTKDSREQWQTLAKKWELNVIQVSSAESYRYSCEEVAVTCVHPTGSAYYLLPPCCYSQLKMSLSYINTLLTKHRYKYRVLLPEQALVEGTETLHPPWQLDIKLSVEARGVDLIRKLGRSLMTSGMHVINEGSDVVTIRTPDFSLSVQTDEVSLASDAFVTSFCGVLVPAVSSAAVGNTSAVAVARTEAAGECPRPGHHSCRDQLTADDDEHLFGLYSLFVN